MTEPDRTHEEPGHSDPYGETEEEEQQTVRGEQGTSLDPHDDTDPQSGSPAP